jgi:hypothetical protein
MVRVIDSVVLGLTTLIRMTASFRLPEIILRRASELFKALYTTLYFLLRRLMIQSITNWGG